MAEPEDALQSDLPELPEGASELTPEDLAIIEAFRLMEDLEPPASLAEAAATTASGGEVSLPDGAAVTSTGREEAGAGSSSADTGLDDMLALFVAEADEDIASMRQALTQLEQEDRLDEGHLEALRRCAHKLKGTAGAVGCPSMSTIAYYIEMLVGSLRDGSVPMMIGLMALVQAMRALEATLQSIVETGQESSAPLTELEADYEALNEFGSVRRTPSESLMALTAADEALLLEEEELAPRSPLREEIARFHLRTRTPRDSGSPLPSVLVDAERLKRLILHSEHLAEQREPLENARRELEAALQELYSAQARLQYLETLLSLNPLSLSETGQIPPLPLRALPQQPMSSLVARILEEAEQAGRHLPTHAQQRQRLSALALKARETTSWDEMEVDRYTESDVLLRAFAEAIADVSTASAQVRAAFTRLDRVLRRHMDLANRVRGETLLLRSAPLAVLLPRIRRAIRMSADAQRQRVRFEARGETTEVDQDILEALARPLLQLVRYGMITNWSSVQAEDGAEEEQERRVWFYAHAVGNEVSLELGFSTPVRAGALELVQGPIQQLQGTVTAQRNALGGVTFYLTLPRLHGAMHGLLVRTAGQRLVVPFSQVRRIVVERSALEEEGQVSRARFPKDGRSAVPLSRLLGLPDANGGGSLPVSAAEARPLLLLQEGLPCEVIEVDEVLGGVELVVRPVASYLRRPGIMGAAIDGQGNVLLVVDLMRLAPPPEAPEAKKAKAQREPLVGSLEQMAASAGRTGRTVMIADDSVYIRQSLQQTLQRAGYRVVQARDGMEAWELLLEQPPDVLLLDIEMPHLNGYELLSMIRASSRFASLKIIMLTARSSEKHRRSAQDLGAQAYLIKPSPPELLLDTIGAVLSEKPPAS
ncbi:MAG: response regulator [Thermogemmatispora sp.]|uniref:ATP-binding response regulator n=1 Tax=Thermogemmatispora sp. TaxID=1968838 RepID=UPI0019E20CB4|nr:response regulator [Thermogemmatispora sp.]MBE3567041.1 response regulator [Thermogemmatispora sp.]